MCRAICSRWISSVKGRWRMPDRLLKEGLKTSRRVGVISERAELLFVRLILTVCPLGRYHAEPELVKQATLPNRPRIRTSHVAAALDELESSRLISRYSDPDGASYLCIPKFGQRLKYSARSPYPPPPHGPADAPGQEVLALPDLDPLPLPKREEKRREVCVSASAHATHTTRLSDEEWQAELRKRYPALNIPAEMAKAKSYVARARGQQAKLTREFFEQHWLTKAEQTEVGAASFATAATVQPEPEAWRAFLKDTYPEESWAESAAICDWATMPANWRAKITREFKS